jgi:DNA-binding SARP family transcriptional activator
VDDFACREHTFRILGPMSVKIDGQICTPTAGKIRQILALMLSMGNRVMSIDTAIEELWGDSPPRSAVTVVQTYVYQLRRLLERYGYEAAIRTEPPGYVLNVQADDVDAREFGRVLDSARHVLSVDETARAAELLTHALRLWSGAALANMSHGSVLRGYAARLEEQRMIALELWLRASMKLGRHRELVPELRTLVAQHPYNEWMHAQLMIALHASGRRGDALAAYQEARSILDAELGLDPSPALQRTYLSVLKAEPVTAR